MSQGMGALSNKQERLYQNPSDTVISDRTYNLVLGGVIVYGVLVNILMVKLLAPVFMGISPLVLLIGYFISCFAGIMITYRSSDPLISFLGYNLVVLPVGAVLSVTLQGFAPGVVFQAFLLTGIVTGIMLVAATAFPGTFAGMGRMLFVALIGLLIGQVVCMLFHIYPTALSWVAAVIFSLYIGYDWVKAQAYVKTLDNAVDSAMDIYMDIINLFLQLLRILASRDNN
ncbi:MAG: Bax inhibitor-1 family protein [Anaerovoracaceae bacterium]